jgi:hypothetical protein
MSLQSALARVDAIEQRIGEIGQLQPNTTTWRNFDTVLATAQDRFTSGPVMLNTPAPGTAQAGPPTVPTSIINGVARSTNAKVLAGIPADASPDPRLTPALRAMITRAAAKYGVPAPLVLGVARAESGFNPAAVSGAGAQGMMQLMPDTGRGLGVTDPFDAAQSVEGGVRYLANALRDFKGNLQLAVASYNAGVGAVRKYGGVPPYAETQAYVRKVLAYAQGYGLNAGAASTTKMGAAA